MKSKKFLVITGCIMLCNFALLGMFLSSAQGSTAPLVYVCQGTQSGSDPGCVNKQEFEVFDTNGAPIYSVGESGGDAVFGDNRSIFAPGNVFVPAGVWSYTNPVAYDTANHKSPSCTPGQVWIETASNIFAVYKCNSLKTWFKAVSY